MNDVELGLTMVIDGSLEPLRPTIPSMVPAGKGVGCSRMASQRSGIVRVAAARPVPGGFRLYSGTAGRALEDVSFTYTGTKAPVPDRGRRS
jgi:hypothetical protein